MERPIFQPIGSPAEELDTPALVVDLGVMEQNIAFLHDAIAGSGDGSGTGRVSVRPHVSCHGCPEIVQFQLAAANNSGGVAVRLTGGSRGICRRRGYIRRRWG